MKWVTKDLGTSLRLRVCVCVLMYNIHRFLYQVFPGTVSQCERLLLRAAHAGDITTVQKLVGEIIIIGDPTNH